MKKFLHPLFVPVLSVLFLSSCKNDDGKFVRLSPSKTHIDFTNKITENDTVNIFDFANIYNGGGVGVGDFNNDGLQDLYFTGNMVPNKLYLNQGKMEFKDVTAESGTDGKGNWSRGVAVVDVNNDGLMDMYVCATAKRDPNKRINMLYVNQGLDKDKVPVFKDMAAEYGLADTTQSTMAYFFDYDNDGDLDVYIAVNHIMKDEYTNAFRKRLINGEHPSTGRLYRNDWSDSLKHPVYTDVSRAAGILIEGFSHAADIVDINNDGWMDILVANDYISSNVLYINNHDGTFTDHITDYFKHTAANSMGSDAVDLNNDGKEDIIEVDMAAEDNLRKKMFQSPSSYQTYQNSDYYGYQYQYVRNMIHVNQGPVVGQNDSIQHPVFADLGYFSGMAETDWSWTPLVTDFDNDGKRDVLFTNGFRKDITDRDFITYRKQAIRLTAQKDMLAEIPEVRMHNYVYRNNGNLTFTDKTKEWGITTPAFSNGAVYADLDNDGDIDVVINTIDDPALVYENKLKKAGQADAHYLQLNFAGPEKNRNGIGATAELHYNRGQLQVFRNNPYRGYISSVQAGTHFGLDSVATVDSMIIKWPDGKMQLLKNVKADQSLTINYKDANEMFLRDNNQFASGSLIRDITDSIAPGLVHKEDDFIDFSTQKLLPHKLSDLGPPIAVGDINGDGLEDAIIGGSVGYSTEILLQQSNGKFSHKDLQAKPDRNSKPGHDMGLLLFDADKDGDLDLYISNGGYEMSPNNSSYADKFYLNDGKGNFSLDSSAFPSNFTSKSCVRAVDYNKDGLLDIFVAGRCVPWQYPKPASCTIYRNDSKDGQVKFTDVTQSVARGLIDIGMTCDALFTDFDNDGWPDLVMAGEFMPVKFFKNNHGKFEPLSTSIDSSRGWWNSLIAGDFDNDGDIDYVAGNAGYNGFYRPSPRYPVTVYGKDFDNNQIYDALVSVYLPTSQQDTTRREFPADTRDDLIKQMIEFRNKFQTYNAFAHATFDKLLSKEQFKNALILSANDFHSSYIRNDGNGKFSIIPLPEEAQFSPLFGMLAEDVNGDGNLDLVVNGNDYGTSVSVGRSDQLNGLVLLGDGHGNFRPLSILESGLYIPGNGKALVKIAGGTKRTLFMASQNRGPLKVFELKGAQDLVPAGPNDVSATVTLKNGQQRKEEFYFGAGYLSQSGRFVVVNRNVQRVEFLQADGSKRTIAVQNP